MTLRTKTVKYAMILLSCLILGSGCGDLTPSQVHLTVQGDASTSVTITWLTTSEQNTGTPTVWYGTRSGEYTGISTGTSHEVPNEPFGFVHDVRLTDLQPGSTYYYICGDGVEGWSPEHTFTTAPDPAEGFVPDLTFVVVGDMGISRPARENLSHMTAENPSFALHAGDLCYANGFTPMWDIWFDQISPLAAYVPYMPSIGNHENEPDLGLSSYLGRFALPNNERWYSFDWGNIHVVSLDTESPYTPESDQLVWLEKDLGAASTDPFIDWIFVFFHEPPYSACLRNESNLSVRDFICPLLESYRVDVVFSGHAHNYERSFPIYNEEVVDTHTDEYKNPKGTIYVVTGGGGYGLYRAGMDYWTVYSRSAYHHVKVDIQEGQRLQLQAISRDGLVLDQFLIMKSF